LVKGRLFTYRFTGPATTEHQLKEYMKADLHRFFKLDAFWKTEKVECLVLRLQDSSKIAAIPKTILEKRIGHSSSSYSYTSMNNSLNFFVSELAESFLHDAGYPIIDESGYGGKAYFELEADMKDWTSVNDSLRNYSMSLTKEQRELPVLYLIERGTSR
jgi:hypothetical protein